MEANPQKQRTGLSRLFHAFGYSLSGLRAAWFEKAFRQEAIAALVLVPSAFWLGSTWLEIAMLVSVVFLVMSCSTRASSRPSTELDLNGMRLRSVPKTWAVRPC
jgi:hypothetical protein